MRKSIGDWSWLPDLMPVSKLARRLGVPRQTVHNWVIGRNDPDGINILRLAMMVGSAERLANRANINIEFDPPSDILISPAPMIARDRDYSSIISITNQLKYIGQFDKLHSEAKSALEDVAGKDKFWTARLLFDVGYAELMLGRPNKAIQTLQKGQKLLPQNDASVLLGDMYWLTGECIRIVGKVDESYGYLDTAQKIYKKVEARPSLMEPGPLWLEWDIGRYFAMKGRYDKALDHIEHMEQIAQDIWLAEAQIIAACSRANILELKGDFSTALLGYLYAAKLASDVGDRYWEAAALWSLAEMHRKMGQFEKAVVTAKDVRERFRLIGNKRMVAKADCVLAACYLQTGKLDKAWDLYDGAIAIFRETKDIPMQRTISLGLGLVELAQESQRTTPNFSEPFQAFLQIDSSMPESYDPYLTVYEHLANAEVLRHSGYIERALTRFHTALTVSLTNGYQLETAHALLGIAAAKLDYGETDRESSVEAQKIYKKVGCKWGQIQVFIIQALIERHLGESNADLLHENAVLAYETSLYTESQLLEKLAIQHPKHNTAHVLLFVPPIT